MPARPGFRMSFTINKSRFASVNDGLRALANKVDYDLLKPKLAQPVVEEMEKFLVGVSDNLARLHGTPWPSGTTDNTLSMRGGGLIESIRDSVKVWVDSDGVVQGRIGGKHWARVHEYGTVGAGGTLPDIVPVSSKYLTVPLPPALDARGLPIHERARDWESTHDTFIYKSKKGNLLIAYRDPKNPKQLVNLYVLKESVAIKPRLRLREALKLAGPAFVDKASEAMFKNLMAFLKTDEFDGVS